MDIIEIIVTKGKKKVLNINKFTMTYREKIQEMIQQLQDMYDEANSLRDLADLEEKKYWNALRAKLPDCWDILQKLDDSMADKRAAIKL